jgi:hypothetical protein
MDDDDDGIKRARARKTGWPSSVGIGRIVSDEGKEWIAREALKERWLEGSVCARWQTVHGEVLRKHEVLIGYS